MSYTQANLISYIGGSVHDKFSQVKSTTDKLNQAVRFVGGDVDLRSTKRAAELSPNLFADMYDYAAPSDLKADKIIDISRPDRTSYEKWLLVDEVDFQRFKSRSDYRIALKDASMVRKLHIDGVVGTTRALIHDGDSLTANGTWALVTSDSQNLRINTERFITGNGAIEIDTDTGGTTAVIELTGADTVDLSDNDEEGSFFVYVYIPSTVTISELTNFILRIGNDSSNYWAITVTNNNEATGFQHGWNLLRFDWSAGTETGTVDPAAIDYARLTITKDAGAAAATGWLFDDIVFRVGRAYDVIYYSKYLWKTSAGVYIENATTTTDIVIADTDEVEGIAFKGAELAAQELKEWDTAKYFGNEYQMWKRNYISRNPSEALKKIRNYGLIPKFRRY